jgi:biopolymer transport protein ExbD
MGMAVGGAGAQKADINVTPLVDVLLVLLIIFMVITPLTPTGLEALLPQPPEKEMATSPERAVVLELIRRDGNTPAIRINQSEVARKDLKGVLSDIYKTRAEKVMFVKGDESLSFIEIAQVLDIAHSADPSLRIGLVTSKIQAGSSGS